MKIFTMRPLLAAIIMCFGILGYGQVTTIDFETAGDGYTPSTTFGSSTTDVFNRVNTSIGGNATFYWAAEDISGDPTITLDQIDVAGSESFVLTIDMLTPNTNDWDSSDEFSITYSLDGGASQNLLWVRTINNAFNNPAAIDADFSGRGDNVAGSLLPAIDDDEGAGVGNNFENFTSAQIPLSGNSTLDITISFVNLDANDEGIYFDNIVITETVSSIDPEPTNHPTNFLAATGTPPNSVIDLVWDDAVGAQLPAGYLIKANTTGTFTDPVDGTDPAQDTDLSDGEALVKVPQGDQFYSFSGLSGSTQYFFKIWPYTNSSTTINFKTDGTPEETDATTAADCGITALGEGMITCDTNVPGDDNDFVTITLSYTGVDANAVLSITTNGTSEANNGDDPTTDADGTISFAALEGDSYTVTITGGSCNLSDSGGVASAECDPAPTIAINEVLADPDSDVNGDGTQSATQDEFVEIFNSSPINSVDISDWEIRDATGVRHVFPAGTVIEPLRGAVVFGGGTPSGIPSIVQTASTGSLGINNGGDNIQLFDDTDALIDNYNFGSSTNDVSAARNPDFAGGFVNHTTIATNPVNYSPGRLNVDNTVLPVVLNDLRGERSANGIEVTWQTATETNNSHFLVQRSNDEGKTFTDIGQVAGQGDSNRPVEYTFVDTKPAAGLNYYRLQQFDYDGTSAFFGPVAVRFGDTDSDTPHAWPVPTANWLQVELPISETAWQLEVYDLNGKLLSAATVEEKSLSTSFNVSRLPAGSYFLRWSNGRENGQQRFVKM